MNKEFGIVIIECWYLLKCILDFFCYCENLVEYCKYVDILVVLLVMYILWL